MQTAHDEYDKQTKSRTRLALAMEFDRQSVEDQFYETELPKEESEGHEAQNPIIEDEL